ncbi:fasciclin domain-containing protein [Vibrio sp. CAU 1672]|uniref:fasciclin domain-containing protein n=1 Tax=Vibrio sp. CAU 1672 TaxID=3032594 RepID=UPI0023D99AAE|nr:fasciclin domain-containing protein [Vibrio sp. CAU 1672]MDF2152275.1 fasciclin domain-containing protein [Vibrio sp. CAU 1672]
MTTSMRSLSATVAILTLVIFLATPAFANTPKWATKSDSTIVEFAVGASGEPFDFDTNGEDFDILVAALIATGTVEVFDGSDFTVFAPNDQAFYNLTGANNDAEAFNAVVDLLDVEGVAAVLAYHVTEGVHNSRSVTRAKMRTMLDGNTISFDSGLIIAGQSEAGLLDIDNRLADGMVHVIDSLLLP